MYHLEEDDRGRNENSWEDVERTSEGSLGKGAIEISGRSLMCLLGSGRTGLTKFVQPLQKSRQNLSLPNFQFVKRGRTETQQNIS